MQDEAKKAVEAPLAERFMGRTPPVELLTGITLDDLQGAGERAFQRGWDAAALVFGKELEEVVEAERREGNEAADAIEESSQEVGRQGERESMKMLLGQSAKEDAKWLVSGMRRTLSELPKNASQNLRSDLEAHIRRAEKLKAGVDRVAER